MIERFTKDARAVVAEAEDEARERGAQTIEAEHLLLAVARRPGLGLSRDVLTTGLDEAFATDLRSVGIALEDHGPPPRRRRGGRLRFGTSAKLALERALGAAVGARDRRIEARHVGLGVLAAEVGTVPRALAAGGLDREALAAALRHPA